MAKFQSFSFVLMMSVGAQNAFSKTEQQPVPSYTQNQIEILQQQISALTDKVNALQKKEAEIHYKEKVTQTDQAPIQMVQSGNDKAKLKISGSINHGVAYYDNGRNSILTHVDVNEAPTRLTVASEANYNKNLKVGAVFEFAMKSNSSDSVDVNQVDNSSSSVNFTKRKIEVYFNHLVYGKLSMGHGETATNYISGSDLTGTDMLSQGADLATFAGGVCFVSGTVPQQGLAHTWGKSN